MTFRTWFTKFSNKEPVFISILIFIQFSRQRKGPHHRGSWWEINSRVQILWQNLFNICCHDKTQEISSWRKKVCLSWKSLSLPILPWKIPEQSQFDKTYGEIFMQTGTRSRLQIKVSAYLSYLIPRATRILVILVALAYSYFSLQNRLTLDFLKR